MMSIMRTTIDIPPLLHQRIAEFAQSESQSFSAVATQALMRGMAPIEGASSVHRSANTGLLVVNSGRCVTSDEVADLIDEDL